MLDSSSAIGSLARRYGELPLPNLFEVLKLTEIRQKELKLLRNGAEALVAVPAMVTDGVEDEHGSRGAVDRDHAAGRAPGSGLGD